MKNMKFAAKLLLIILLISVVSIVAVSTISYMELLNLSGYSQDVNTGLGFYASDNSKAALIAQAEDYLSRLSSSQAEKCNMTLARIQSEVSSMAGFMTDVYENPDNFKGKKLPLPNEVRDDIPTAKMTLAKDVVQTPELEREMLLVSNAEYMFSNIYEVNPSLNNTYLGTESGINFRYSISNIYNPDYDPRTRPWYVESVSLDFPLWLDTYTDSYNSIVTTCSMAFKNSDGEAAGVVAVDIRLSTMVEDILSVRIGQTGYAFLLDDKGEYLAHPKYSEIDSDALGNAVGSYKEALFNMTEGKTDVREADIDGTEYYIAFAPLSTTGWSLGIVVEKAEIVSAALEMKSGIDGRALEAKEQIRIMLNNVMFRFITMLCVSIVLVLILSILVSGSITKPVTMLTKGVIEVGKGNLENKIEIKSRDEIGVLAESFNKMTDELKHYISNLSKVTAEKERIATELNVATQIQADMLPNIFPAFPDREEFEIYATMQPAKEVGGDFYDFFMIDDDHLGVVIADVSGKGVPAALFMVIAKTLINTRARNGESPQDVFINVNDGLCEGNEASLFVTAWMGVLQISTGEMIYVNAGHNPPLLKKSDGKFEYLSGKKSFVLAGLEGTQYRQQILQLGKGDMLYLYTDGVTEALNASDELYGEKRLRNILNTIADLSPTEILPLVKSDIDKFAGGVPQFDDITMLALELKQ